MSRSSFYVRFVLLVVVLGTVAALLGGDPWGPN
jgi:hypothetical protein